MCFHIFFFAFSMSRQVYFAGFSLCITGTGCPHIPFLDIPCFIPCGFGQAAFRKGQELQQRCQAWQWLRGTSQWVFASNTWYIWHCGHDFALFCLDGLPAMYFSIISYAHINVRHVAECAWGCWLRALQGSCRKPKEAPKEAKGTESSEYLVPMCHESRGRFLLCHVPASARRQKSLHRHGLRASDTARNDLCCPMTMTNHVKFLWLSVICTYIYIYKLVPHRAVSEVSKIGNLCLFRFSSYLCIYLYLSTYLSVCLSIHPSIHLSICLSIHPTIYLSTYLSIYLIICLSTYLPISAFLSFCLTVCLSSCLSICLSICLSVYLPIYLSPSLSLSIYTYLYLSIPIYTYLYLSIPIFTYLYLSIPIYTYLYPSINPSIRLSMSLSLYLCIYLNEAILQAFLKKWMRTAHKERQICETPSKSAS